MGNSEIKNKIWSAITANDPETLRIVLLKYPSFIDQPISDDKKTNAITRAAYLERPHIIAELLSLGADINKTGSAKISALMWAAAKGNIESLKLLINFGANLNQQGPHDLLAIDFAVLFGAYNTAYYLYNVGSLPTKGHEKLTEIKNIMKTPWIDYAGLLMSIEKNIPPDVVPFFTLAPIYRDPVFDDPVRDPNETWGHWVHRVLEFERPPLVEKSSLRSKVVPNFEEAKGHTKEILSDITFEALEAKKVDGFEDINLS